MAVKEKYLHMGMGELFDKKIDIKKKIVMNSGQYNSYLSDLVDEYEELCRALGWLDYVLDKRNVIGNRGE